MSSYLRRGLQTKVDSTPIEDGKILFGTDTGRLFIDLSRERIEITDVIKGLNYSEIVSIESPAQKLYLAKDTHQILSYDFEFEDWVIYSGGVSPEEIVSKVEIDSNGDTVITMADSTTTKVIENTKIKSLEKRIEELEKTLKTFTDNIEIIQNS